MCSGTAAAPATSQDIGPKFLSLARLRRGRAAVRAHGVHHADAAVHGECRSRYCAVPADLLAAARAGSRVYPDFMSPGWRGACARPQLRMGFRRADVHCEWLGLRAAAEEAEAEAAAAPLMRPVPSVEGYGKMARLLQASSRPTDAAAGRRRGRGAAGRRVLRAAQESDECVLEGCVCAYG